MIKSSIQKATLFLLGLLIVNSSFLAAPFISSAAPSASNVTGDVMDDRPGDADSVGGDQSSATSSISESARSWAKKNGFDLETFENYTAPSAHKPSSADIKAFESWMNGGGSNPRIQVMK